MLCAPAALIDSAGLLALLDHLVEDREHLGVIERDALVDLALLDGGAEHADAAQAILLAGTHGCLHVLCDFFLQGHVQLA